MVVGLAVGIEKSDLVYRCLTLPVPGIAGRLAPASATVRLAVLGPPLDEPAAGPVLPWSGEAQQEPNMPRTMLTAVLAALGIYLAFLTLVYLGQSSLVYLPDAAGRGLVATPAAIGLAFEDVHLRTEDGVSLHGWLVSATEKRPQGPRGTLLFFHGNAGNISHRLDSLRIFAELGLDVFIFDYRGYGRSAGRPSEVGTYRDATAAWRWLTQERRIDPSQIVLFGRSLGAAVAIELATRTDPVGLIVESAFTSVPDLGAQLYPFLPVRLLSRYRYDNLGRIASVRAPLLVVHSRGDEIVPFRQGQALFSAAREPKQFLELQGGHNDGFLASEAAYRRGLAEFLASLGWQAPGKPRAGR
jgi:fermentation-respiration switch protein FrsA (DUF1100 family)